MLGDIYLIEESLVFWSGALIFIVSFFIFIILENRNDSRKEFFGSHIFVSFITTISYLVMALALSTVNAANGQPIYWTRWLFYVGSCSILTLDIATISNKPNSKKAEVILLTALTMFCGFLASVIITSDRWWFFGLSTIAYILMLYTLFKSSSNNALNISPIMWFVMITWSLFPVVWVLAPTGFAIIGVDIETILYLVLDLITKIAFGIYITIKH
jgi:sensory rhodopsin